jgi:tRNA-splicing ligase RtcB
MNNEKTRQCPIYRWIPDSLTCEVREVIDRLARTEDVQHLAIMPDVHLANDICIGTVMATQTLIFPGAIGSDIGCGMAAIRLSAGAELFHDSEKARLVLKELRNRIPTTRHCRGKQVPPPVCPDHLELSSSELKRAYERDGVFEFGTLGSGNHFLEVQADEDTNLWLMVHTGSRGMGHHIQEHHLHHTRRTKTGFQALDAQLSEGKAFLQDVQWALSYARENRKALLHEACRLFKELFAVSPITESFRDCHHNSVTREEHFGKTFWVHRKGANMAHSGMPGIIPGSMGSSSFLTLGRGCPEALCSSSHGAGRRLSRTEARHQIPLPVFQKTMAHIWFESSSARKLLDEAPDAYKDIKTVMRAQRDLVKIETTLRPIINFKGTI